MAGRDWKQTATDILQSKTFTVILVLIPIILALFFRLYPATLPVTDDWAESSVRNNVINQLQGQVRQDFPLLPQAQVQQQARQGYEQYKQQNQEQIDRQVDQLSDQFKSRLQHTYTKPNGETYEQTYLLAIDPYQWLRRAENVADTDTICDTTKDGECWNDHTLAPNGRPMEKDGHTTLSAWSVKAFGALGYGPMTAVFYLPAIIAALATIPAFFIVKRRFGSFAGMIAGLIVALHTAFLSRTPAGFADTDAYNVFFPLYIAWLFLLGLDRNDARGYAYMGGAAVLTGVYSYFWSGWFFAFILFFAALAAVAIFALARALLANHTEILPQKEREQGMERAKRTGLYLLGFTMLAGAIVSLLKSPNTFINAFTTPFQAAVGIQDPVKASLWPNVYTTVAELNVVSINNIIGQIGGRILFLLGILGIFTFLARKEEMDTKRWSVAGGLLVYYFILTGPKALGLNAFAWLGLFALPLAAATIYALTRGERTAIHYGLFTMGWFVASIFATTQGTRFLLLLVPILALTIGFAAGWLVDVLSELLTKEAKLDMIYGKAATIAIVLLFLLSPVGANLVGNAHSVAKNEVPSMNDAWWDSLTEIKENSSEDAIITSWWDFGHWFKYVADRAVTFDGGTQNTPQAHWVGRLLQTSDREESLATLRMLNCGGNDAYDAIQEDLDNNLHTYRTMQAMLREDKQGASRVLSRAGIDEARADEILTYTHCTPPDSYLIVSQDMVGKAGVWSHFGLWDFDRAFVVQASRTQGRNEAIQTITRELNTSTGRATQLYTQATTQPDRRQLNAWVSPWPSFVGTRGCSEENETITCDLNMQVGEQQGVSIVATTLTVDRDAPENATIDLRAQGRSVGTAAPAALYLDGQKHSLGADFPFSIQIQEGRALIAQDPLIGSTFAQLYYYEDGGDYFELLTKQRQINGGKILVYKVDWDEYTSAIGE